MKKNNIKVVAVVLLIIGLLLGIVGTYLSFNNNNNDNNSSNKEMKLPTDMNKISKELDKNLSFYVEYKFTGDGKIGTNVLNNAWDRLEIVNCFFQKANKGTLFNNKQSMYVKLSDYKAKYKELYGSLDSFDKDTTSPLVNYYMADKYDKSLSSDLVAWTSLIGTKQFDKVSFSVKDVNYDKKNKEYTITGVINYKMPQDVSIDDYTRDFTLTYANNGTNNYMTSLVIN